MLLCWNVAHNRLDDIFLELILTIMSTILPYDILYSNTLWSWLFFW